jgi:hypothetical protein
MHPCLPLLMVEKLVFLTLTNVNPQKLQLGISSSTSYTKPKTEMQCIPLRSNDEHQRLAKEGQRNTACRFKDHEDHLSRLKPLAGKSGVQRIVGSRDATTCLKGITRFRVTKKVSWQGLDMAQGSSP